LSCSVSRPSYSSFFAALIILANPTNIDPFTSAITYLLSRLRLLPLLTVISKGFHCFCLQSGKYCYTVKEFHPSPGPRINICSFEFSNRSSPSSTNWIENFPWPGYGRRQRCVFKGEGLYDLSGKGLLLIFHEHEQL